MAFSKTGRVPKDNFRFVIGEKELEQYVSHYKYLGVNISNTAKWLKNICLKAKRTLFSITQSIFDKWLKPSATCILHIFDTLVKPIA